MIEIRVQFIRSGLTTCSKHSAYGLDGHEIRPFRPEYVALLFGQFVNIQSTSATQRKKRHGGKLWVIMKNPI